MSSRVRTIFLALAALLAHGVLGMPVAQAANGGTVTYKVGSAAASSTTANGPYSFGALSVPTRVSLSDVGLGVGAFEDVFTFSIPDALAGSTASGSQLDLDSFATTSDITALKLENWDTKAVIYATANPSGTTYTLTKTPIAAGNYALIVDGNVAASSVSTDPSTGATSSSAQYSGALVAVSPVPEPAPLALLTLACGLLVVQRRRRGQG